jgi:ankyrin repeat protein
VQALMFAVHRVAQDSGTSTGPIVHLLSAGASVAAQNRSGLSAAMIACTSSSGALWKLLVRLSDDAVVRKALEGCDMHGNSALHLAAREGATSICENLIAQGVLQSC